jgi:hypothetical protein
MRANHHVSFSTFYTWSKTLNSVQLLNTTNQGGAQNFSTLAGEAGRADSDQRHVFTLALNFQPDYYNGSSAVLRHVINGWAISPIVKFRSGTPLTILNGSDANLDGQGNDRAQLVGDPYLDNPTAAMWFNTAAFAQNPQVTGAPKDGNSPRNFLDAPGYRDIDLAISRDFRLSERFKLSFRGEATNAFNIVSLNGPGTTWGNASSNFGKITTAQAMRKLQLGLRLTY